MMMIYIGACQRCDRCRLLLCNSSRNTSSLAFAHKQVQTWSLHFSIFFIFSSRDTSSIAFAHKQVEQLSKNGLFIFPFFLLVILLPSHFFHSSFFPISARQAISVQLKRMKEAAQLRLKNTKPERRRRRMKHQQQKTHLRKKVPQQIKVRMKVWST